MILTKDNLLRFVVEKKFLTPTAVSEKFETSTMIASAALSELSKSKLVGITNLKLGASPYYYDINQPECLSEIGDKHLKSHEQSIFLKLKNQQIVNDGALPIPEKLAAERLKDFSVPLEIEHDGKKYKFWIWYLRDLGETRTQIMNALTGEEPSKKSESKPKAAVKKEVKKVDPVKIPVEVSKPKPVPKPEPASPKKETVAEKREKITNPFEVAEDEPEEEDKIDSFIKNYLKKNYLKVEGKKTAEKFVKYNLSLRVNDLIIKMDAVYFSKKPADSDILKFYMSGNKPKIVFIENAAKKHYKLSESLDNLEIVNI
jgi:hypothetical protein